MELELRFRITENEYHNYITAFEWTPPTRVCDLTLGPSGPTSMQTDGWVVRLRQNDTRTRMEYKAPMNAEWSAWVEYGTDVSDFGEAVKILRAIGLKAGLLLDRTRRTAQAGPVTLSLDDVKGLGQFIEVEVQASDPNDSTAHHDLEEARKLLKLEDRANERPYGEILLARLNRDPEFKELHAALIADLIGESVE